MKKIILPFFPCIFIFVMTISCQTKDYDSMLDALYSHTVPVIKSSVLDSLMNNDQKPILLDIRSHEEFEVSHLQGARLIAYDNFRKDEVEKLQKSLPRREAGMPIIVYCSVGYRSEKIGEELLKMGFTDIKNLYGGIFQWKNEGFQVVNKYNLPTDSIHAYDRTWAVWLKSGVKVF